MRSTAHVNFGIGVWFLCVTSSQVFAEPLLDNGTLVMDLAVSPEGVPYIRDDPSVNGRPLRWAGLKALLRGGLSSIIPYFCGLRPSSHFQAESA